MLSDYQTSLQEIKDQFEQQQEYKEAKEQQVELVDKMKEAFIECEEAKAKQEELELAVDMYEKKNLAAEEEKKELQEKIDQLQIEVQSKKRLNETKVTKRIQDNKNPQMKELFLNQEAAKESIDKYKEDVKMEKDKFDKLLEERMEGDKVLEETCLLYTSPSPRDRG